MIFVSEAVRTLVPRCWRMYLPLWLISRWRLPATPAFSLPNAVILKRFLAPDLVFNFGILLRPLAKPSSKSISSRHGMPLARRLREGGVNTGKAPEKQGDGAGSAGRGPQ